MERLRTGRTAWWCGSHPPVSCNTHLLRLSARMTAPRSTSLPVGEHLAAPPPLPKPPLPLPCPASSHTPPAGVLGPAGGSTAPPEGPTAAVSGCWPWGPPGGAGSCCSCCSSASSAHPATVRHKTRVTPAPPPALRTSGRSSYRQGLGRSYHLNAAVASSPILGRSQALARTASAAPSLIAASPAWHPGHPLSSPAYVRATERCEAVR